MFRVACSYRIRYKYKWRVKMAKYEEGRHLTPEEKIALQAEEIKQLWQENEQLRAIIDEALSNTPAYVEALRKAREAIKAAWSDGSANAAMDKASEALAAIDKVIGGKEDV
jgi:hypothetical protein